MKTIFKWTLIWLLGFLLTAVAAVYQRMTGPTYPKKVELTANDKLYKLKLIRSQEGDDGCALQFNIPDTAISAKVEYRRYPVNEEWSLIPMQRKGDMLMAVLPDQPAAGKLEYKIHFEHQQQAINNAEEFHTIVRFKDKVPGWVLYPHILLIFIAMLLSNITGYLAITKAKSVKTYAWLTFAFMLIGGMVMGPVLQLYAFGDLWTGVPFGWDLTDNKTLIAFIFWIIALYTNRKQPRYGFILLAAVVTLVVFSIPHSMFGSEFNYTTGTVTQG